MEVGKLNDEEKVSCGWDESFVLGNREGEIFIFEGR
jgi:hypothetical protein